MGLRARRSGDSEENFGDTMGTSGTQYPLWLLGELRLSARFPRARVAADELPRALDEGCIAQPRLLARLRNSRILGGHVPRDC